MKTRRPLVLWLAAAAAVIIAAVVSLIVWSTMTPTMTQQQATDRAEQHLQEMARLVPGARLELADAGSPLPCGSTFGGNGQVLIERVYWLRDIPKEDNTKILNTFHDYWQKNGYTLNKDERQADPPAISARHPDDDFLLVIQANLPGDLRITVDSTCVQRAKN